MSKEFNLSFTAEEINKKLGEKSPLDKDGIIKQECLPQSIAKKEDVENHNEDEEAHAFVFNSLKTELSKIENLISIDYSKDLAFNTSEIVFEGPSSSQLGMAILGYIKLG